jgi:peptide/nickel transport system permease protein
MSASIRASAPSSGRIVARFRRNPLAVVALVVLAAVHLLAALAPWIAPYGPEAVELFKRLQPPSGDHWLGTDEYGRDVLTRLLYGGQVSLAVALASMATSIVIGVVVGAVAGYAGGLTDAVLMRITDGMLAVPLFFIALLALAMLGTTMLNLVLVIALSSWMTVARAVRAEALRTRELEFVLAARAVGCGRLRILARHRRSRWRPPSASRSRSCWSRRCPSWASVSSPRPRPGATCSAAPGATSARCRGWRCSRGS